MISTLKKMDKKYLIIIGGIFGVIILIIVFVAIFRACTGPGTNYEKTERKMISATEKFLASEGQSFPKEFESKEVSAEELAGAGFMDDLTEYLVDVSCTGKVTVFNNGGKMLYVPNLDCTDYKTQHLADKIKKDSLIETAEETTEEEDANQNNESIQSTSNAVSNQNSNTSNIQSNEQTTIDNDDDYPSGLYDMDGTFVFRGKHPNNYLSFGGLMWRIIDINVDGIIRAIKISSEKRNISWDNKYNSTANKTYGINDYKNSYILETMNSEYKKFKATNKVHLAPYSVCVGKRGGTTLGLERSIDCAEMLEHQYISVISSSDYGRASLDENCTKITSGACNNYNYLSEMLTETWTTTAMNRNTYEVVYINNGLAAAMNAQNKAYYNWVIAFNGYEKYISGKGTAKDPYVIGTAEDD